VRAAGIRRIGGPIELLDISEPPAPKPDELVIDVYAAGVANWDDIVRRGGWDVGTSPPMALGVEAAGTVRAVGSDVSRFRVGDEILTHSFPLRYQGAWAEEFVAPESHVAPKPPRMDRQLAGLFPVPALIAHQALQRLGVKTGDQVLVNGAGGMTGSMLVAVAVQRSLRVIAVAGSRSAGRVKAFGASTVLDYRDAGWMREAQRLAGNRLSYVVNAVPGSASSLMGLIADDGRLVTITSDPPDSERGIVVTNLYVTPDGNSLDRMATEFVGKGLALPVAAVYGLGEAGKALSEAVAGSEAGGLVIDPRQALSR
jgi:NADPH:quinone reductase-like Zn-dependent oxidoreductase